MEIINMKKLVSAILTMALLSSTTSAMALDNKTVSKKVTAKRSVTTTVNKTVKFSLISNLNSLKPEVTSKIEAITNNRGFFYMANTGGSDFIFRIAAGQKPNGGYGIKVKSITYADGKMKILVEETLPVAGKMYTEQLTYPTVTFKAPLVSEVVEVKNTKGQSIKFTMPKVNTTPTTNKTTININKVSSFVSAKLLVPEGAYSKELTMTELKDYFGKDPIPVVPANFTADSDKANIMFKPDGNIFFMSEFTYSQDKKDPNSPTISLQLNKDALPPRDCFYSSTPKESIIGGTKLVIGLIKMNDNTLDQTKTNETYDVYTSQFIYKGIGYDITAKRIDEKAFITLLTSLIK